MTTVVLLLAKEIYCMNLFISTFISDTRLNLQKIKQKHIQKMYKKEVHLFK